MSNKVILISNTDGAMYKFRRHILEKLSSLGIETVCIASPSSPEGSYCDRLIKICGKLYTVDFFRQGMTSLFRTPFKIFKIVKIESPRCLHIFGHEALLFAVFAILFHSNTRKVLTITGLGKFFSNKRTFATLLAKFTIIFYYSLIIKRISSVIFLNSRDIHYFSILFPKYKHLFVQINGEGSNFNPSSFVNNRFESSNYNIVYASRLMPDKGIIELLNAFVDLPISYQLIVLGTIDESIRNDPLIISMIDGKMKNVKYYGFVEDINGFLDSADCVILPSKYMEGLPIILVEALAKGKFIITSDAPGCSDTVSEALNGFILPTVTKDTISNAVLRLGNVDFYKAHDFSVELFKNKFSADSVVGKIIQQYDLV